MLSFIFLLFEGKGDHKFEGGGVYPLLVNLRGGGRYKTSLANPPKIPLPLILNKNKFSEDFIIFIIQRLKIPPITHKFVLIDSYL